MQLIWFCLFHLGFSSFSSVSVINNGKQSYSKSFSSKSIRNVNGDIISESKGCEKNSDGLHKMAYQARLNDKYYMIGQERDNKNKTINNTKHLIGIADEPNDIQRFHQSLRHYTKNNSINHHRNRSSKSSMSKQLL